MTIVHKDWRRPVVPNNAALERVEALFPSTGSRNHPEVHLVEHPAKITYSPVFQNDAHASYHRSYRACNAGVTQYLGGAHNEVVNRPVSFVSVKYDYLPLACNLKVSFQQLLQ